MDVSTMGPLMIVWNYAFLIFSYFCVYAVIKHWSKNFRYGALFIYLVTAGLYSFLLIDELITPSEDANIGLGGSILLMGLVSIAGIIYALITYLVIRYQSR